MKFDSMNSKWFRSMLATSLFVAVSAMGLGLAVDRAYAGTPYVFGDLFAAVGNGQIIEYSPTGSIVQTLNTLSGAFQESGICFAGASNLYATNYSSGTMTKFDNAGNVVTYPWGFGFNMYPSSCVVNMSGDIFTGETSGAHDIRLFNPAGNILISFWSPAVGPRGTQWIDLSADQCTMLYTSEDDKVWSYNTCTNTQNPNFATGLSGLCEALRIRSNGDVMVACTHMAYRLNSSGTVLQTYPLPSANQLQVMSLDPDGTSFWTGDFHTGVIWHIDIATGFGTAIPAFTAAKQTYLGGLAIYGEPTVGGIGGGEGTGFMIGGGYFLDQGKKVTHGFELHCDAFTAPNNLEVNWGKGNEFHLESLTSATCSNDLSITTDQHPASFNTYSGSGTGQYNGVSDATATWTFADAGEPGRDDEVTITIVDAGGNTVLNVGPVNLRGGNFQAHD